MDTINFGVCKYMNYRILKNGQAAKVLANGKLKFIKKSDIKKGDKKVK